MKITKVVILLCTLLLCLGCNRKIDIKDIAGKQFVYEKGGFRGDFSLEFYEDGTFHYYEGLLSSYIGVGEYTIDDNIISIKDNDIERKNSFKYVDDELVWIEEVSDNFGYIKLENNAKFVKAD